MTDTDIVISTFGSPSQRRSEIVFQGRRIGKRNRAKDKVLIAQMGGEVKRRNSSWTAIGNEFVPFNCACVMLTYALSIGLHVSKELAGAQLETTDVA